jgi:hypothetical protein
MSGRFFQQRGFCPRRNCLRRGGSEEFAPFKVCGLPAQSGLNVPGHFVFVQYESFHQSEVTVVAMTPNQEPQSLWGTRLCACIYPLRTHLGHF